PVAELGRQGTGYAGENLGVVPAIVHRLDASLPDLQERVGTRRTAFVILEFNPRVDGQNDIGILRRARPLDLLGYHQEDRGENVDDDVVNPFSLVKEIRVVVPDCLGGRREVAPAGEDSTAFGGLDGKYFFAARPVGGILAVVQIAQMRAGDPRFVVQHGVER